MAEPITLNPPLKWHGGKHYLAERIVEAMPPHTHYVEAYGGGLAVLLAKDPAGVSEVVNDLNGWLINFWQVLRDGVLFEAFRRRCEATEFSEPLFEESLAHTSEPLTDVSFGESAVIAAWWFFIKCRMSMAGRMKSFSPLSRNRTRRGMNEQASAWITAIDGLQPVHRRLRPVVILNKPALEVIRQQDGPKTLHYLDPTYAPESRTAPDVYTHEMSIEDHADLLDLLASVKGHVMLSGYDCLLYRERLSNWERFEIDLPNNAAGGAAKRRMTEIIWCNFTPNTPKGV